MFIGRGRGIEGAGETRERDWTRRAYGSGGGRAARREEVFAAPDSSSEGLPLSSDDVAASSPVTGDSEVSVFLEGPRPWIDVAILRSEERQTDEGMAATAFFPVQVLSLLAA